MRISDWSSDVCSSDLLVPDERHAQFHNRDPKGACQPAARDRWRPFRSAERPPTDRLVSSSDIRPVSAFECQNFPRLVGSGDAEAKSFNDLPCGTYLLRVAFGQFAGTTPKRVLQSHADIASHGCCHGDNAHLRSEEHTSELQSLMRIS